MPMRRSPNGMPAVANVRVVADEGNNALLVYATESDYERIEAVLLEIELGAEPGAARSDHCRSLAR